MFAILVGVWSFYCDLRVSSYYSHAKSLFICFCFALLCCSFSLVLFCFVLFWHLGFLFCEVSVHAFCSFFYLVDCHVGQFPRSLALMLLTCHLACCQQAATSPSWSLYPSPSQQLWPSQLITVGDPEGPTPTGSGLPVPEPIPVASEHAQGLESLLPGSESCFCILLAGQFLYLLWASIYKMGIKIQTSGYWKVTEYVQCLPHGGAIIPPHLHLVAAVTSSRLRALCPTCLSGTDNPLRWSGGR